MISNCYTMEYLVEYNRIFRYVGFLNMVLYILNTFGISVFDNLECTVNAESGSGDIILHHNFGDFQWTLVIQELHNLPITKTITYEGLSTDEMIQGVVDKSEICEQTIYFPSTSCWKHMTWTSLNGDVWSADMINYCDKYVYVYYMDSIIYATFTFCMA